MGYAQGQLNKDEGIKFIKETWTYMESQIENVISFLPQWLQELIANLGLDLALDFTCNLFLKSLLNLKTMYRFIFLFKFFF